MLRILLVTFSVKVWSKEAQGYKSNILLLQYQYAFIDVFFRKSIIEIWEINPWLTNLSINGSREEGFIEIVGYFGKIGSKTRKCYEECVSRNVYSKQFIDTIGTFMQRIYSQEMFKF